MNVFNRYAVECDPPEWKERGTGDVRIMKKEDNQSARILMRREKTLKVCANHYITPWMDMKPNCGSQKAWVWKTQADFADEEVKQEVLLFHILHFVIRIIKTFRHLLSNLEMWKMLRSFLKLLRK